MVTEVGDHERVGAIVNCFRAITLHEKVEVVCGVGIGVKE